MCTRGRESSSGFTLIETVAAIVILAVAVPPMIWAVREAQVQRVDPVLASRARWLAAEKLEDVVADRHSASRGYAWLTAANYPAESEGAVPGHPQFSRAVTFAETGPDLAAPGTGYMTVTVEVGWDDARGMPRTLSVSTVLTEYAP